MERVWWSGYECGFVYENPHSEFARFGNWSLSSAWKINITLIITYDLWSCITCGSAQDAWQTDTSTSQTCTTTTSACCQITRSGKVLIGSPFNKCIVRQIYISYLCFLIRQEKLDIKETDDLLNLGNGVSLKEPVDTVEDLLNLGDTSETVSIENNDFKSPSKNPLFEPFLEISRNGDKVEIVIPLKIV